MNAQNFSYEPKYAVHDAPKVKAVELRVVVTDCDLEVTIKKALVLARSAGRELDLTFVASHPGQNALQHVCWQ